MSSQMLVSRKTHFSSELQNTDAPLPVGMLAYFRARLSNRIHELVLAEFIAQEREGQTSRAELARKIRKKPEQITRWLGSPGNWTIETLSDLLLGMGLEAKLSVRNIYGERTFTSNASKWESFMRFMEVQTAQEVARDIADGNHKQVYFSIRVNEEPSAKAKTINITPYPELPQQALNVSFVTIPEQVDDRT